MTMSLPRPTISTIACTLAALALAVPASAQFRPRMAPEQVFGENYHVEGGIAFWFPTADLVVQSGGSGALSGLEGTEISAKNDLGLQDKALPQFNLVLRPARHHKLRVQYIAIKYEQTGVLPRSIDFNGQRYQIGLPVNSSLDWKALRLSYEYDFVLKERGFAGFIIEDKQTDVRVDLQTPLIPAQFAHAQSPIPALGGIGRFYIAPRLAVTGEVTGFRLPESIDDRYRAHYVDVDIYATVNANNNIGVQAGYRSLDLGYKFKEDSGSMTLKGVYVGIVARY